ncbi:galactose-6-phosphate isomerase subunit LacB [Thermoactinomyces mirandus]|uniref:Galactose-6-phosphate isomerase subunit LacB n=1 Tax=Thermoactinomyces mirandus TaxID=2756294 RepID=A0A7W1XS84_9BACL|nr:galactose-6-phosphate isomerase subunit LacB [Thermoactinomyces mirandus]MBA4602337.1 galactose-6-phosphate isomerase subunit LacB [Thermoactinomyces mirandus]
MKISIGCDHIVTDVKDYLVNYLREKGHEVIDNGTYDKKRTHYPIFGKKTAEMVVGGKADLGIVLCGTGVGITISAAKVKGVRAALVEDVATARYAREQLNANVLGIGGQVVGIGLIEKIVDAFLETDYKQSAENDRIIAEIDSIMDGKDQLYDEHFFDEFIEKWNNGGYPTE